MTTLLAHLTLDLDGKDSDEEFRKIYIFKYIDGRIDGIVTSYRIVPVDIVQHWIK